METVSKLVEYRLKDIDYPESDREFDFNAVEQPNELQLSFRREWVARLRSGQFKQAQSALIEYHDEVRIGFCCLGVAACVIGEHEQRAPEQYRSLMQTLLSSVAQKWVGIEGQGLLAHLNDSGLTFAQIADVIEYFLISPFAEQAR